jgi:hypothetical protein
MRYVNEICSKSFGTFCIMWELYQLEMLQEVFGNGTVSCIVTFEW